MIYPEQREFRDIPLDQQRAEVRQWFIDHKQWVLEPLIWSMVAIRLGLVQVSKIYEEAISYRGDNRILREDSELVRLEFAAFRKKIREQAIIDEFKDWSTDQLRESLAFVKDEQAKDEDEWKDSNWNPFSTLIQTYEWEIRRRENLG